MDNLYSNIEIHKHQRGKHLNFEDRCTIKHLTNEGKSLRYIAKELNCSPSTVMYELRRGTIEKTSAKGRPSAYIPTRGQKRYEENRKNSHRKYRASYVSKFMESITDYFINKGWSVDSSVGYAKRKKLYSKDKMMCTKSIYNAIWRGDVGITPSMLPEALKRNTKANRSIKNKRILGTSIEKRPDIVNEKVEFGHWEIDTVVPLKNKHEAVMLTLIEKVTRYYITIKIPGKESDAVNNAINSLKEEYGYNFSKVFKTITSDNGSEFAKLNEYDDEETSIYFTHPYSSWERAQNERCNRILRKYIPKGESIEGYTEEEILSVSDIINSKPRKVLQYFTSEELFEAQLDKLYSIG
ncbi:integrase core domain protein [Streptococcus porcinus]|uniref:IS30 family transposase n=1 Tax=Streptococcus porcinus TaxID=1340 RepID=UPI0010CAAE96|nr:IS30 family transposase [Streptococcus porcinus]VTS21618.1 integrase core domain protein [Streptococcus porcinus]